MGNNGAAAALPMARAEDPATSHAAARSAEAFHEDHWGIILSAMMIPSTIYQIAAQSGLSHVQVARRLPEMERRGLVRPSGALAKGASGRMCRLWERSPLQQRRPSS